jgi:hypothetical protein
MSQHGESVVSGPSTYSIGNQLFVDLRAFLCAAGVDPTECKLTITFPNSEARSALVDRLMADSPPISECGRVSAAQAGNYGGTWQGVSYQFDAESSGEHP